MFCSGCAWTTALDMQKPVCWHLYAQLCFPFSKYQHQGCKSWIVKHEPSGSGEISVLHLSLLHTLMYTHLNLTSEIKPCTATFGIRIGYRNKSRQRWNTIHKLSWDHLSFNNILACDLGQTKTGIGFGHISCGFNIASKIYPCISSKT